MRALIRSFTYDNLEKPDWLLINKTSRPMFVPASARTLEIMGRRGLYYFGSQKGAKEISLDITIMAESDNDLWLKIEWLNGWLDQGKELPLTFNDEPGRFYQAVFVPGSEEVEQVAATGAGRLTFLCPDPYKFGQHYNYLLGSADQTYTLTNNGNADMRPLYVLDITKQQNYIAVVGPEGFIQYGSPHAIEEKPVLPLERVLFDQANDLAPWTTAGTNIDYGMDSGSMMVRDGHMFVAQDFGDDETNKAAWHGPVYKRSIPQAVKDFRVTASIEIYSTAKATGRVEVALLNAAGAIMARMILWDKYLSAELTTAHITAGANTNQTSIIESAGPNGSPYNDMIGNFVLRREGTDWRATVTRTDSKGREVAKSQIYSREIHYSHQDDIAQIQIGMRKYGTTPAAAMGVRGITVERINQVTQEAGEAPAIFQPGDRLEIDTASGDAWLNGEYFNQHLDPGSKFFGIKPGFTDIRIAATDPTGINVTADYDERYK